MDAADALAQALLLRRDDAFAAQLLADLEAQGWTLVHLPTIEQAADAICHQPWRVERRDRETGDAEAVLNCVLGVGTTWPWSDA